jgi:hypothetical protein
MINYFSCFAKTHHKVSDKSSSSSLSHNVHFQSSGKKQNCISAPQTASAPAILTAAHHKDWQTPFFAPTPCIKTREAVINNVKWRNIHTSTPKTEQIENMPIENNQSVRLIERKIASDFSQSQFNGKHIDRMMLKIHDDIRNLRSLTFEELDYIRTLSNNDLFLLLVLSNQCVKAVLDIEEPKAEIVDESMVS